MLQNVRASFVRIVEPEVNKSFPNSPAKYSMNLILPKDHPALAEFMAEVQKLALDKWKEHAQVILGMANANKKLRCYGAGEEVINSTTFARSTRATLACSTSRQRPTRITRRRS